MLHIKYLSQYQTFAVALITEIGNNNFTKVKEAVRVSVICMMLSAPEHRSTALRWFSSVINLANTFSPDLKKNKKKLPN